MEFGVWVEDGEIIFWWGLRAARTRIVSEAGGLGI